MDDHFVIDVHHFGQLARELEPTRRNIVGLVARFYYASFLELLPRKL